MSDARGAARSASGAADVAGPRGHGMALSGEGAVAIWHDIAPEGRETFYAWHGQ
jgi:hypothetical protein